MELPVQMLVDSPDAELALRLVAGESGLGRAIDNPRVQKPGLALAGFLEAVRPRRIQVIGRIEIDFLASLDEGAQQRAVEGLLSTELSCVVLTYGLAVPERLREVAERRAVPVFSTQLPTSAAINRLHRLLDEHLSPEAGVHGVLIDVFGVGVLLQGKSGIGKSEAALDLIIRGHRLVSDDMVFLRRISERLIGSGSPVSRHHMEVRGLGIINVKELFGAASVREQKFVELLVEMVDWQEGAEYDRLGIDDELEVLLDVPVPRIRLPLRPGRNVGSIIKVAARNHLLKMQGHNAARLFQESLEKRLRGPATDKTRAEPE